MTSVLVLVLLFVVVPIVELYVIIQVGQTIGALNTVGLLVLASILGGWLMKREGLGVMRRVQAQVGRGEIPTTEIVNGFLIVFGGALMLTPGFLTDLIGMSLLLPPVRAVVRRILARRFRAVAVSNRTGGRSGVIDV